MSILRSSNFFPILEGNKCFLNSVQWGAAEIGFSAENLRQGTKGKKEKRGKNPIKTKTNLE